MDFEFTEEQKMFQDMARKFAEQEILPLVKESVRQEIFQPDGNIKPSVQLLVNGSFVNSAAPLQDAVNEGDTLSVLAAMFGG